MMREFKWFDSNEERPELETEVLIRFPNGTMFVGDLISNDLSDLDEDEDGWPYEWFIDLPNFDGDNIGGTFWSYIPEIEEK